MSLCTLKVAKRPTPVGGDIDVSFDGRRLSLSSNGDAGDLAITRPERPECQATVHDCPSDDSDATTLLSQVGVADHHENVKVAKKPVDDGGALLTSQSERRSGRDVALPVRYEQAAKVTSRPASLDADADRIHTTSASSSLNGRIRARPGGGENELSSDVPSRKQILQKALNRIPHKRITTKHRFRNSGHRNLRESKPITIINVYDNSTLKSLDFDIMDDLESFTNATAKPRPDSCAAAVANPRGTPRQGHPS